MIAFIKRHRILAAIVFAGLVAGIVVYYWQSRKEKVDYVPVKRGMIVEAVYGIGTVHANRMFELKVGVASAILALPVKEGDFVSKGTKLIVLDGMREFYAPFEGVITSVPFKVGEVVFPQTSMMTLTDFKDRYLIVSLEQQAAILAKNGQVAKLSFESIRDQSFDGKVVSVYSNEDRFLVRIEAAKLPQAVLPGMTADVAIVIKEHENAILVPVAAIELGKVRVRRSGSIDEVEVTTGIVDGEMAQVKSGDVKEGDEVVVSRE